jgi:F-type H+-transporting ATPase subunit b
LAQAQAEAERIRAAAEESAKTAREAILAAAVRDVERLKETAAQDLDNERDRAIAELRERVAAMAVQRVESQLRDHLDDSAQHQLIDRSIAILGGGS